MGVVEFDEVVGSAFSLKANPPFTLFPDGNVSNYFKEDVIYDILFFLYAVHGK